MKAAGTRRILWLALLLFVVTLAITGCAGNGQNEGKPGTGSVPEVTQTPDQDQAGAGNDRTEENGPVVIRNQDMEMTFAETPTRAVSLNQHVTEIMLALGLEESMVGTAYLDDRILPEFQEQYDNIPVLSDKYPSKEVFLNADPDFAYAGWNSAFAENSLGLREELAELGILTYVQESSNKPGATLEDVYQDILNIGRIFRVEEKAEALVDEMRNELAQIQESIGDVTEPLQIFVYDSGEDKALTAANTYLTSLINSVGGKNIFDDVDKGWTEVSWEEVVSRNPDVILLVDYGNTTVEAKQEMLLSNVSLSDVTAIVQERFIIMPLSAAAEGIRAPIALRTLAEGLYPNK